MNDNIEKDYYIPKQIDYTGYRNHQENHGVVADFNHAMLGRAYEEVYNTLINNEGGENYEKIAKNTRKLIMGILNISHPQNIIFGRNTTEALSFIPKILSLSSSDSVLTTNCENVSVIRVFQEQRDHGNSDKTDSWTTFPDSIVDEKIDASLYPQNTKESNIQIVDILDDGDEQSIIDKILTGLQPNTKLVLLSHVIRFDGRVLPIKKIAQAIKSINPEAYIAIDGAQAVGNLANIDFSGLENAGIDFYAFTAHKRLGAYPLGTMIVSKRIEGLLQKTSFDYPIMEGMFDKQLDIPHINKQLHTNRLLGFQYAIKYLEENGYLHKGDFSEKSRYAQSLKDALIKQLGNIINPLHDNSITSPSILALRINGDNKGLVSYLGEQGYLCTYISNTDSIRISFEITNTVKEIITFSELIQRYVSENSL